MNSLVAIVGPTAVGKSRMAMRLAQAFPAEIVSADSRQVYRYMDIGTAKPSQEDMAFVPHHLIDIIDPDEDFSLAQYQEMAYTAIKGMFKRGKTPLLVGGSGMYVWSVLEGWQIPRVTPDLAFRRDMERMAAEGSAEEMYARLKQLDPDAAQKIDPRNVRRVIRALEIYNRTGAPKSRLQGKKAPAFRIHIIGLTMAREELYRKADKRVDEMVERGLVTEVEKLVLMGYDYSLPAMSSIGYRQIGMYLRGEISLEEAARRIKFETHRFVRHQYGWFRKKDARIIWYDVTRVDDGKIIDRVAEFFRVEIPGEGE